MIESVVIRNFKIFHTFGLALNADLNIIVGDNEAGKSTLLEAISLALTRRLGGKPIEYELSPFLFNKRCAEVYCAGVKEGTNPQLPEILIELYLKATAELEPLRGNNNTQKLDCVGVKLQIAFDEDYKEEYEKLLEAKPSKPVIPAEYYKVNWLSFAGNAITARSLALTLFHIDATAIRLQSGTDYYIQNILSDALTAKEKVALAISYRSLKLKCSPKIGPVA